jgi:hypothetical protein
MQELEQPKWRTLIWERILSMVSRIIHKTSHRHKKLQDSRNLIHLKFWNFMDPKSPDDWLTIWDPWIDYTANYTQVWHWDQLRQKKSRSLTNYDATWFPVESRVVPQRSPSALFPTQHRSSRCKGSVTLYNGGIKNTSLKVKIWIEGVILNFHKFMKSFSKNKKISTFYMCSKRTT